MYKIKFYENRRGDLPVLEYIEQLALREDKQSRIRFDNVMYCIEQLREHGTRAPEKFVKHLKDEIWELRLCAIEFYLRRGSVTRSFCSILFKRKRKKPRAVKLKKPNANLLTSRRDSDEHDDKL